MKRELLVEEYNAKKNIMVTGDVSVGKTRNVMFPLVDEIINLKDSMLILDAKEEYINRYYEELKVKDYNVVILNLKDLDKSEGWNLLSYPYNLYKKGDVDGAIDYIKKLGDTIFYEVNSNDQFWTLAAKDLFVGLILGLFEDGKIEEINLNSINKMLDYIGKFSEIRKGDVDFGNSYFKMKNPGSLAKVYASSVIWSHDDTKSGVCATAKQKILSYIGRDKLNLLMNRTTFSYEEMGKKPTAIFVMTRDYNRNLNSVASMFIEQLFEILVDMKIEKKFNFILDNFEVIERFNNFGEMLGSGISRNIKFILGTRSLDEVLSRYGAYVRNLGDVIRVSLDSIEFEIGNRVEKISNDFDGNVEIDKCNVIYPVLEQREIKLFDLSDFVRNKIKEINSKMVGCQFDLNFDMKFNLGSSNDETKDVKKDDCLKPFSSFNNKIETSNNVDSNLSVEEMLERINKKIAELEADE